MRVSLQTLYGLGTMVIKHRNYFPGLSRHFRRAARARASAAGTHIVSVPVIRSAPLKELLKTVEWLDFLEPDKSKIHTYARTEIKEEDELGKGPPTSKASIVPNTDRSTNTLELPNWLPQAVKDKVSSIYASNVCDEAEDDRVDILMRLARDSRMKNVWADCTKSRASPRRVQTSLSTHHSFGK